ncbi:MAG: HlyD family efflux transporter periplasmic adaptor subunit [Peptococcaceae bacterium MAG4]|nr:HlyD family efflux transporter periplasmic adaptor subunit [Peptococcaceae bacterium MAG4]
MRKETTVPISRKRKRRTSDSCLLYLALVALLICVAYIAWGRLVVYLSGVQFLTQQEISRTVQLQGILIKEEMVIRSPVTGKVHFMTVDGNRIEMGAPAAEVVAVGGGASSRLITPSAGMFCNHIDGLENVLSPANLDVLDFSSLDRISHKQVSEGELVEKGQPVFKLIDNLSAIYLYTVVSQTEFPAELKEKNQWLKARWNDLPLMVKAYSFAEKGDSWEGLLQLSGFPDELVHNRQISLEIVTNRLAGFLVPHHAVVYRDETPGIYLAVKKRAQWVPVKVEGELQGKVAISGRGLGEDTRYVSNPMLIREGSLVE